VKDNPLLALDFDKVHWWRIDREEEFEITVAYGDQGPPLRFKFRSAEELEDAYNEYWGLPPYPPNL
jgi:hypothetical protein